MYNMSNNTVSDCEGILFDSELGDVGGTYDHNENYTFSICIAGNGDIIMDFLEFCTEEDFDFLSIYDGPNISSPQIGDDYHGEIDPPQIVATSGCLSLNFTSDPNVVCTGWEAHWYVEIQDPIPVDILPIATVPCESNSLNITFAEPVPCDSIYLASFQLLGPQSPPIASVSPAPCIGNMTTNVSINLASPISTSGNYQVVWTTFEVNECGGIDTLISNEGFQVIDCPVSVFIDGEEEVCAGDCITLTANASGGLAGAYTYNWSSNLPDTRSVEVCPISNSTYTVTVSDANGSTDVNSITIAPLPVPDIDPGNFNICQSDDPFLITASPLGGTWSGMGFDEDNSSTGLYNPTLTSGLSDTVIYEGPNGCLDQVVIEISLLDAGTDDAACPGSDPFMVSGGLPEGGTWSGNGITPEGIFNPTTNGNFEVTYTHPNGCSGSKMVNVGPIVFPTIDSVCQSEEAFILAVTPVGGMWSGDGIDEETNLFDPGEADAGDLQLLYEINGCSDSLTIFIKEIDEARNITACPDQAPFILPGNWTVGGVWSGIGILNPTTGLYDPSILGNDMTDTLTFSVNGCSATRLVRIRYTDIPISDTLRICTLDDPLELDEDNIEMEPDGGIWSGPGTIFMGDDDWIFDPSIAGTGVHQLFYEINDCIDSMLIKVSVTPSITSVPPICVKENPIVLQAFPNSGIWEGAGITNEAEGLFDPQVAFVGFHEITFETFDGCQAISTIEVFQDEPATISGLDDFYCYKDSNLVFSITPPGGNLTVDEAPYTLPLNPVELGSGKHMLHYSVGTGLCYSEVFFEIEIGKELLVSLPSNNDSLCFGESLNITAQGIGGDSTAGYTYHWNQNLGFGKTHYITPTGPTNYSVSVDDGCSQTAVADLSIFVHPNFSTSIDFGPTVCFDDTTFARLNTTPIGDYAYTWDSDPPFEGDTYFSYPTSYNVEALNEETGCYKDIDVQLPGFDLIRANFMLSPNVDCISTLEPDISVIDLSVGARDGYWDFGDGSPRVLYEFGSDLLHTYADTGNYTITLHLENEGNCVSEDSILLCVNAEHRLFAPNAFTPNYDGKNDVFAFKGFDIASIEFQIYNRWGQLIYTGSGMNDQWDGFYKGNRVSPGVYTFMANYVTVYGIRDAVKGFVTVVY